MKKTLCTIGLLISMGTFAQSNDYSRFENKTEIITPEIITSKIITMETLDFFAGETLLLNNKNEVIPHKWVTNIVEKSDPIKVKSIESSSLLEGIPQNILDQNFKTTLAFETKDETKKITINFAELTEITGLNISLDNDVITPRQITVKGVFKDNQEVMIIDQKKFSNYLSFPTISVTEVEISINTPHLLRISDIEIINQKELQTLRKLVFFAENKQSYTLYSKPHFGQKSYSAESYQPLTIDADTPSFSLPTITKSRDFNNDFDGDGLIDEQDLCPKIFDSLNIDADKNNRGDVCEDPDQDNIISNKDNCPFIYNPGQKDSDLDLIGDLCDDAENRVLETSKYLLYMIFFLAAICLGLLVLRSFKK